MATLIITILSATIVAAFAGFNLGNSCDVSLAIHTFRNIPVFVTVLVSFALGVAVSLPIAICSRKRKDHAGADSSKRFDTPPRGAGIRQSQKTVKGKHPRRFSLFSRAPKPAISEVASSASVSEPVEAGSGEASLAPSLRTPDEKATAPAITATPAPSAPDDDSLEHLI